jgi:glycosyltransferase involved in cell wall biosynthesis
MAAGRPVVTTSHMQEIIEDGITGFMSKTSSPEDFATRLHEAVQNPELAQKVAKNAHQKIASRFLWQHYIRQLVDIYRSVLN